MMTDKPFTRRWLYVCLWVWWCSREMDRVLGEAVVKGLADRLEQGRDKKEEEAKEEEKKEDGAKEEAGGGKGERREAARREALLLARWGWC